PVPCHALLAAFPTRRSSDLAPLRALHRVVGVVTEGLSDALAALDADLRPAGASLSTMGRGVDADPWYFLAAAAAGRGGGEEVPGDRKSTRLNSSHEWRSYAV